MICLKDYPKIAGYNPKGMNLVVEIPGTTVRFVSGVVVGGVCLAFPKASNIGCCQSDPPTCTTDFGIQTSNLSCSHYSKSD